MKTVALISSYREGEMVAEAIESARAFADAVIAFEGSTDDSPPEGEETVFPRGMPTLMIRHGDWAGDAAKRTELLERARAIWPGEPLWALWLDGDELLIWGQHLRAYLRRIDTADDPRGQGWKFPLRLVELDGSVVLCHGKLIRADLVRCYHRSTTDLELADSPLVRVVGNEPNWKPAVADATGRIVEQQDAQTATRRPPLQGEPHLLHRSFLRPPARAELRLHEAEAQDWSTLVRRAGLAGVGE